MILKQKRRCQRCVMDETDENIVFYEDGSCNHCRHADKFRTGGAKPRHQLADVGKAIKEINGSDNSYGQYDCIVGLSGGVDSSWVLHLLHGIGLKVFVYHVDTGWNTPKAVSNIYRMCEYLDVELHTHVVDWKIFSKIQRAYFYSGVINQDVPQDIAIFSSQIAACKEYNIRCLASGANNTTESILPRSWGHHYHDIANMESIYKQFWGKPISSFPYCSFEEICTYRLGRAKGLNLSCINILDTIEYRKKTL